ncbi:TetR/AcrR family transcriptional regulator [Microbacterium sp.]|uniref:TetR/AcrR family transcriptional regulator n=1 Tax=Microbacterium sp. TaxID=51671 RepID=UPI00322160D5
MATDGSVRTPRVRAKADRQAALLREAARLFAARGFDGVSLEDLGASVGVTGPAIYRHFSSKRALLGAILVRVSEELLDGGRTVEEETPDPTERLDRLIAFHVDFALSGADVIRVHDRELGSLSDADRRTVRTLQRTYVALWVDVLAQLHPERPRDDLRVRAHANFGLINSTSYSLRGVGDALPDGAVRGILESMARAALAA